MTRRIGEPKVPPTTRRSRKGNSLAQSVVVNMSDPTYNDQARFEYKPLIWLKDRISTPPFSLQARREAGLLLRQLQMGILIPLPHSRPMPAIGPRCHELRIDDRTDMWRIIYRIEPNAIVILACFKKKGRNTPYQVIAECKDRWAVYSGLKSRDGTRVP